MSATPLRRIEGKYEILEKLGEGGMGAVYKVRHRLLDDVRVIKMMRPQLVADEEFKARFQREARVAIQLRHPNVAHLIDFTIDEEDGTASIVMEFIDGMTLEEVLRHSGPPPLGLALEIGQQALRALGCLHERGFVHRDISPDNLMLTADAEGRPLVKLIDLGIAKLLGAGTDLSTGGGHLTATGIFLGKVRYSSPEQFGTEGAAMVDARGDLYSLGVVLYELLTGRYPIQGKDPSSLIAGHLFRSPLDFADSDPEGRVPPELRALLLRALAKEPAQRFASSRARGAELARLRAPGDVADGDLRRALTRPPGGTVRVPVTPPGSTQDRLNAQFGLRTTPSSHGGDGGKAAPPPARRSPEVELRVRTLLREAESLLERNDYEGALAHLERGKALAPGNAEVQSLLEKAELAVRARRRTRDLTGVQEEIEAALARGDYRAAEMRLYQAEASFGEQEVFTRLHERLGELRRADLEARRRAERLMAVIQRIEEAFAAGDLAGALEEARQALELDPESARAKALAEGITAELGRREEAEAAAREAARLVEIAAQEAARRAELETQEVARQAELEAEEAARQKEIAAREAAHQAELEAQEAARRAAIEAEEAARRAELEEAARIEEEALRRREEAELAAIRAERRRREKEAERAEQLAAAVAAIDACLDGGDPEGAARQLPGIASIFGDAPALRERWERVEAMRHRQELESALVAIDEALEGRDLAVAARRLPAAVAPLRRRGGLRERWERLEALQRAARVEALRTEAASLVRAGHLDRAARKLRQALGARSRRSADRRAARRARAGMIAVPSVSLLKSGAGFTQGLTDERAAQDHRAVPAGQAGGRERRGERLPRHRHPVGGHGRRQADQQRRRRVRRAARALPGVRRHPAIPPPPEPPRDRRLRLHHRRQRLPGHRVPPRLQPRGGRRLCPRARDLAAAAGGRRPGGDGRAGDLHPQPARRQRPGGAGRGGRAGEDPGVGECRAGDRGDADARRLPGRPPRLRPPRLPAAARADRLQDRHPAGGRRRAGGHRGAARPARSRPPRRSRASLPLLDRGPGGPARGALRAGRGQGAGPDGGLRHPPRPGGGRRPGGDDADPPPRAGAAGSVAGGRNHAPGLPLGRRRPDLAGAAAGGRPRRHDDGAGREVLVSGAGAALGVAGGGDRADRGPPRAGRAARAEATQDRGDPRRARAAAATPPAGAAPPARGDDEHPGDPARCRARRHGPAGTERRAGGGDAAAPLADALAASAAGAPAGGPRAAAAPPSTRGRAPMDPAASAPLRSPR